MTRAGGLLAIVVVAGLLAVGPTAMAADPDIDIGPGSQDESLLGVPALNRTLNQTMEGVGFANDTQEEPQNHTAPGTNETGFSGQDAEEGTSKDNEEGTSIPPGTNGQASNNAGDETPDPNDRLTEEPTDFVEEAVVFVYTPLAWEARKYIQDVDLPNDPSQVDGNELKYMDSSTPQHLERIRSESMGAEKTKITTGPYSDLSSSDSPSTQDIYIYEHGPPSTPPTPGLRPIEPIKNPQENEVDPEGLSLKPSTSGAGEAPAPYTDFLMPVGAIAAGAGTAFLLLHLLKPMTQTYGWFGTIRRLLGFMILGPLFVRIKSHKVTEDPKRSLIHRLITENSGISTKEVCEITDMSRDAVQYHLGILERANLIVSERIGTGRHHFLVSQHLESRQRKALALLRNSRNQKLLNAVASNPGITQVSLARMTKQQASQVHRMIGALCEAGLVERKNDGAKVRYYMSKTATA